MKKLEERIKQGIAGGGINLYEEMQRFEASMIRSAMIQAGGVQRKAAELLGMKLTTLNVKIKRYKIDFSHPPEILEEF
jgi:Transcriptional regulator containing GAF, AAA-type ATPase, and DNA binding domains